ncbi:unnamed protein product [Allacma fusca]|uniref:UBC core domain-containing protein n=1 Tax=Allacma fusca TaxID=39272 RepID=A0A8J2NYV5_9HEXA|nr:unnamed protein product [Allacma fusca]
MREINKNKLLSSPDQEAESTSVSAGDDIDQENCKKGRLYPGDLVVYKSSYPWDLNPTFGTVVIPRSPKAPNAPNNVASTSDDLITEKKQPSEAAVITIEHEPANNATALKPDVRTDVTTNSAQEADSTSEAQPSPNLTVHWDTSNRLRQMKRNEVSIIDRMLVRGTRVRNSEGISGTVVNYNVKATLQIVGTNSIIQNVPLTDLSPISAFVRGQSVLYNNWVGTITNVKRKVWFQMDRGSSFFVETLESDGFMKTDPYWGLGVACPNVRTPFSPAVLKNAKWTSKYMKFLWKWFPPLSFFYSFSSATVTRVQPTSVTIKWLAPAPSAKNADVPPPSTFDDNLDHLKILTMPNSEFAGLNSVRMYRVKPEDELITYGSWFSQFRHKFVEPSTENSRQNYFCSRTAPINKGGIPGLDKTEVPVKILLRHNYVDIQWDNNKKERLPSINVPEVYEPKTYESLRCGMVVISDTHPVESKRYGVIQHSEDLVEAKTCTVRVHWFCEGKQKDCVVQDEGITEESIYSVCPHSKFSLFQRNTILFSNDPELHEFNAGVVIDVDITQGNMIIYCTDNRYRKVWPHMVIPFPKRCSWNFFTRKWVVDDLIPPPQQLGIEHYPKNYELSLTEVEEVLSDFRTRNKRGLWEDPQFDILENVPDNHYFKRSATMVDSHLIRVVRDEFDIIRGNVPDGVYIRVYEDRMDLISALIIGPAKTPFENCPLMFDLKLPKTFPRTSPQVQFISYADEIHPLISDDGNFCQANLQWKYSAEDNEVHQPKSYILEAVRSIQGLFFTREPFYADAIRNQESPTPEDQEKSRAYNEAVFLQVLDAYYQTALKPHEPWKQLVADHVLRTIPKKVSVIEHWFLGEDASNEAGSQSQLVPSFPLLPVTKGFKLTLDARMKNLRTILANCVPPPTEETQEAEIPLKPGKARSSSSLVSTLEELLHQQVRATLMNTKGVLEKKGDKDENSFLLADI